MKYLFVYLLLFFLIGCMSNQTTIEQNKLPKKMLTTKEREFIKHLENLGYSKIEIISPTIGDDSPGWSIYHILISTNIKESKNNLDSIRAINYEIAQELYKNVIEDSILFDLGKISVSLELKNSYDIGTKKEFYESYNKKQLEQELKFIVIKKNDGSYERSKL